MQKKYNAHIESNRNRNQTLKSACQWNMRRPACNQSLHSAELFRVNASAVAIRAASEVPPCQTGRGGHCHGRLNPPFALIQRALGCAGRFAGPMAGNRPLPATALASSESPSHAGAPQDRPRAAARDKRLRVRWSDDGSHLGACAAVVVPALVLVKMH